ncbi:FABP family protein [Cellulomonas fimi]|uniref:Ferric nitrobindin-like protein n=1 Tax=Cellulomonas fimi TaxID=1708 RepID=A0A7Y0LV05_CELFI|nr:FABP family protein [Cellulomonas fimi]NMR18717.1 FABP family protein [Cellulomonas fimi]
MPFAVPDGLAPEVYPLAWLVGRWRGEGVVGYPGIDESAFMQDVEFSHDGGPYLRYSSTMRLVVVPDDPAALVDGVIRETKGGVVHESAADDAGPVWATESGYWRISSERPDDLPADHHPVEVLLADPAGHLSLYVGSAGNGRIDLVSDLVARTVSAAEVSAGTRLYGLVQGELMWAWDLAAFGKPLQSYASARLARLEGPQ